MPTSIEQANTLYRNTYNSIGGVDIKAVFFGVTFGNLQAVSYSITREKAPVYTMGSPECRGYARGKRAIAGNLVFVMFDDHALLGAVDKQTGESNNDGAIENLDLMFVSDFDEIRPVRDDMVKQVNKNTAKSTLPNQNTTENYLKYSSIQQWNNFQTNPNNATGGSLLFDQAYNTEAASGDNIEDGWGKTTPWYSDQIPAFNIVLTGVNEDGFAASMSILGVEILNEGYGISIDDLISEQQMTYVARAVARWKSIGNPFTNTNVNDGPGSSLSLYNYKTRL